MTPIFYSPGHPVLVDFSAVFSSSEYGCGACPILQACLKLCAACFFERFLVFLRLLFLLKEAKIGEERL